MDFVFYLDMENKGFADNQTNIETPNGVNVAEKPLNVIMLLNQNILKQQFFRKFKLGQ